MQTDKSLPLGPRIMPETRKRGKGDGTANSVGPDPTASSLAVGFLPALFAETCVPIFRSDYLQ